MQNDPDQDMCLYHNIPCIHAGDRFCDCEHFPDTSNIKIETNKQYVIATKDKEGNEWLPILSQSVPVMFYDVLWMASQALDYLKLEGVDITDFYIKEVDAYKIPAHELGRINGDGRKGLKVIYASN
jgi:hypothetical protein